MVAPSAAKSLSVQIFFHFIGKNRASRRDMGVNGNGILVQIHVADMVFAEVGVIFSQGIIYMAVSQVGGLWIFRIF